MKQTYSISLLAAITLAMAGCQSIKEKTMKGTFGYDAEFLKQHTDAVVLKKGNAAVVVVPQYQGRVMTATARGAAGSSSGWINYALVEQGILPPDQQKGRLDEHIMAFGGEERFWMGPEGGQYSIFFAPEKPFDFADWFTPDAIDNEPWAVVSRSRSAISFAHDFKLRNHSGTRFSVRAERTVELLDDAQLVDLLGAALPALIDRVAYRTENTVINTGEAAWEKESGLLSIWMLCMFQPSDTTTVFMPYKKQASGAVVNADYFGRVPSERLKAENGVIYFKCDGKQRGKIGVTPQRSIGVAGSYDPVAGRVTLLVYEPPKEYMGYVNSMWDLQEQPYQGDALNSYNDGPVDASGAQMGPFYEIESSSPALALAPGESGTHIQTIIHLYGDQADLQKVLETVAPSVDLGKVKTMLP